MERERACLQQWGPFEETRGLREKREERRIAECE
jgi:hypothetical protein